MALALALAGCAGNPVGALQPIAAAAPGSSRVDMLVVTTRSDVGVSPGEMFGGERALRPSFADISILIPPDSARTIGEVQWPTSLPPDPSREFATLSAEKVPADVALKRFRERLAKVPGRRVLLFVHGYNTRFEESVFRLAQIVHDSKAPVLPVLFTWPSRGKVLGYTYDRESANFSRDALELTLQKLINARDVGEVTLLAHSMGNWVAIEALRQLAIRNGGIHPKIKTVMLAAPDVDVDVFRRQVEIIGPKRPPFIVILSRDDKALAMSQRVWGDTPRLGAIDPNDATYHQLLASGGLQVVDLTDMKSADKLNHGKFAENPEVVRMIGGRLADGQTLSDSKTGLGDRIGLITTDAVRTVGRAATVTVSAPIAIIDPETRSNLGDQIQDLGDHAKSAVRNTRDIAKTQ
jgi:esterase/lipase superfamily enzyme